MREMLNSMMATQNALNIETIGANWTQKPLDWGLAMALEAAEAIDHLAWKWWAKQVPDKAAAQVEVVDIMHFCLSYYMRRYGYSPQCLEALVESANDYKDVREAIPALKIIGEFGFDGYAELGIVFQAGVLLDMSVPDTMRLYQCKATLNLFRQRNGYKDGTYVKQWAPETQDNDFMYSVAKQINWDSPTASKDLYGCLERAYVNVKAWNTP